MGYLFLLKMNKDITISLSYFNDEEYISTHLEYWKEYKDLVKFQIIDDCSSTPLIESIDIEILKELNIKVYRVLDSLNWNIPGVRNLGTTVCDTNWILLCDMDQYFYKQDIEQMYKHIVNVDKIFFSFSRVNKTQTAGTMLIKKKDYWLAGGCDEDFTGNYGWNDPYLRNRFNLVGVKEKVLNDIVCKEQFADSKLSRKGNFINKRKFEKKIKSDEVNLNNILRFKWKNDF